MGTTRYINFSHSERLFKEAKRHIPGGVNSPVRAFKGLGLDPLFIRKAQGAYIWDVDDQKYIDYVGSWGPAILGHAHPEVKAELHAVIEEGFSFGAPTAQETDLVQEVKSLFPQIDLLRLVSSGTEACMAAIRLARAASSREYILKFVGCYHGHADAFLVKAGSGVATLGIPGSPGVPKALAELTLTCPFNDFEALRQIFQTHGHKLAAVITEPIIGNSGFIRPLTGFLEELRTLCDRAGTILIVDEVMTGFRVHPGGFVGLSGLRADLICLGKIIGGGLPLAAYGGRRELMALMAPSGPVYQAGTLSGNPLAVRAGLATLKTLKQADWKSLCALTRLLVEGLKAKAKLHGIPFSADAEGAMFGFFFRPELPQNFNEAEQASVNAFKNFFKAMISQGIYLAPSAFEAGFVSLAHTKEDIEATIEAAGQAFHSLAISA